MKRFAAVVLCLFACLIFIGNNNASAADMAGEEFVVEKIKYRLSNDPSLSDGLYASVIGNSFKKNSYSDVDIPSKINYNGTDYPVLEICDFAFYKSGIYTVDISDGILKIGTGAFALSTNLAKAVIPSSCTYLGDIAFYGCTALKGFYLSPNLSYFGYGIFSYCNNFVYLQIKDPGKSLVLKDGAVYSSDLSVLFSAGNASGKLILPKETKQIYSYAFEGNLSVTEIVMPDGFEKVGEGAFLNCTSLKNVDLGGTSVIETNAFCGCTSLKSITLSKSVSDIQGNPFCACSELSSIKVDSDNPFFVSKGGVLFNKDKTRLIAACGCSSEYTIPSSVTEIADRAFFGNLTLKKVTIGKKVENIGVGAFYGCRNLKSVIFKSRKFTIAFPEGEDGSKHSGMGAFDETYYYLYIDLPYGKDSGKENSTEQLLKKNAPDGVIIANR